MAEKVGSLAYETAQLRLAMRNMRASYIENVRTGRCKMDAKALAEFDEQLEIQNARYRNAKGLSAKR